MAHGIVGSLHATNIALTRWRVQSPFVQTLLLSSVIFCCPGMNTAVIGLGAGGTYPSAIPVIDKVNIVNLAFLCFTGFFGGSINNQLGPRSTLTMGAAGYPLYIGSLWWLDNGRAAWFPYVIGPLHGICSALFYSASGYIVTSYAPEHHRGKYVNAIYVSLGTGSTVGSAIVLALTANSSSKSSRVPTSVYICIIAVQCLGVFLATFLTSPSKVRRNDGRAIAYFKPIQWREELAALPKTFTTPRILLVSLSLFSCQMPYSLTGSLNAFYFNSRTRALVNFCFWLSSACGAAIFASFCDSRRLGLRRKRAVIANAIIAVLIIPPFCGLFSFLASRDINRHVRARSVDWAAGTAFPDLLVIYIFLGCASSAVQGYLMWLCSTFSNEPTILSRYSGYIEAIKALGLITAFGIDSPQTSFLTEAAIYFSLNVVGIVLCLISGLLYTRDTKYGAEKLVIVPQAFTEDRKRVMDASSNEVLT